MDPIETRYQLQRKDKTYVDISLAFVPSPLTNDITLLTNDRAINNAIKNIIMFLPTEVPFNRNIGSNTNAYLFDLIDEATAGVLADEIKRAVLFCEPRVTFDAPTRDEVGSDFKSYTYGFSSGEDDIDSLGVFVELQPDQELFSSYCEVSNRGWYQDFQSTRDSNSYEIGYK